MNLLCILFIFAKHFDGRCNCTMAMIVFHFVSTATTAKNSVFSPFVSTKWTNKHKCCYATARDSSILQMHKILIKYIRFDIPHPNVFFSRFIFLLLLGNSFSSSVCHLLFNLKLVTVLCSYVHQEVEIVLLCTQIISTSESIRFIYVRTSYTMCSGMFCHFY